MPLKNCDGYCEIAVYHVRQNRAQHGQQEWHAPDEKRIAIRHGAEAGRGEVSLVYDSNYLSVVNIRIGSRLFGIT